MDTFWFISVIVTPTTQIVKLRKVAKIITFASKQIICGQLFFIFLDKKYFFIPFGEGIYGFICIK